MYYTEKIGIRRIPRKYYLTPQALKTNIKVYKQFVDQQD